MRSIEWYFLATAETPCAGQGKKGMAQASRSLTACEPRALITQVPKPQTGEGFQFGFKPRIDMGFFAGLIIAIHLLKHA